MYHPPLVHKIQFRQIFVPYSWFQFKRKDTLKYRTPWVLICVVAKENCICIDAIIWFALHLHRYIVFCRVWVLVKWKEQSHLAFLFQEARQRAEKYSRKHWAREEAPHQCHTRLHQSTRFCFQATLYKHFRFSPLFLEKNWESSANTSLFLSISVKNNSSSVFHHPHCSSWSALSRNHGEVKHLVIA